MRDRRRSGCSCWSGASRARAARPRSRRTCASRRGSPRASRRARNRRRSRHDARASASTSRARFPRCCRSRSAPRPRASRARRPASSVRPRSPGRTISPWLIGMPPSICARYSPSPMRTSSSSSSPKRAGCAHALRIGGELAERLHIGGKPGQPVRGALLAVEQSGGDPAVAVDPVARPRGSHRPAAPPWRRPPSRALAIRSSHVSGAGAASAIRHLRRIRLRSRCNALQHNLRAPHKRRGARPLRL